MCVCVYIPLYLHPCVFLGMCIYIPMCVSMFQRVCVYICVCVYTPVCVPGTVCLHPCVFLHPCVCLHPCVFQDMCIFVCVGVVSYFCVPDKNSCVKRWCWLTECGLLTKYWLNQKKKTIAIPSITDTYENFVASIVGYLLTSGETSPFYRALLEPNIGSDYAPNTGFVLIWFYSWHKFHSVCMVVVIHCLQPGAAGSLITATTTVIDSLSVHEVVDVR